jgi:hypothetical protein
MRNKPANKFFADSCPSVLWCNYYSSKRGAGRARQRLVTSRIANQGPIAGCKQMVGYLINKIQVQIRRRLLHNQYILSQGKDRVEFIAIEFIKTAPTEVHEKPPICDEWIAISMDAAVGLFAQQQHKVSFSV